MIVRAITTGLRRTVHAPKLLALLWLLNLLAALPASLLIGDAVAQHIGPSHMQNSLRTGFDTAWYSELSADASGTVKAFTPPRLFGALVWENLEGWWRGSLLQEPPLLAATGVLYALLWLVLQGGVLARLAAPTTRFSPARFAGACGHHAGRFLRLGVVGGMAYVGIYRLGRWAYGRIEHAADEITSERTVFVWVLAAALVVTGLLHLVRLVLDYAKIVSVLDDEPHTGRALLRSLGFVRRHPFATGSVYGIVGSMALVWLMLYGMLAPGASTPSWLGLIVVLVIGQLFAGGRLALRVGQLGAQLHLYANRAGEATSSGLQ